MKAVFLPSPAVCPAVSEPRPPEPATPRDVPYIAQLLAQAAPETVERGTRDILSRLDRYLVLRSDDGQAIATTALDPIDDGRLELRSVAVDPTRRGHGLGRAIVTGAIQRAFAQGRDLYCYTFRPRFFERLGFRAVDASELPAREGRPDELTGRRRIAMALRRDDDLFRRLGYVA